MGALETELYGLARLNGAIPDYITGAVGVAATDGGIPAAGDAGAAAVFPTDVPAIDRAGAIIRNTNSTGKT